MTTGFSGLPKLRQSVSPMGRAPTQARLRAASATAMPRRRHRDRDNSNGCCRQRSGPNPFGALDPNHCGIGAGRHHGVAAHVMIVLTKDPLFDAIFGDANKCFSVAPKSLGSGTAAISRCCS